MVQAFKEFRNFGYDLPTTMDKILKEYSEHIKTKELGWSNNVIQMEKEENSEFIRCMLEFEGYDRGEQVHVLFMDPRAE